MIADHTKEIELMTKEDKSKGTPSKLNNDKNNANVNDKPTQSLGKILFLG